jgi:GNAT superfamily N-acetyltransferase
MAMTRQDAVEVERYAARDRGDVLDLLRLAHPPAVAERMIQLWDWKYDANPMNRDGAPFVLLARDAGRLVGMIGALPLRVWLAGSVRLVDGSGDFAVHPEYRRRGISRRILARYYAESRLGLAWVNTLSERSASALTAARGIPLRELVRPLNLGHHVSPRVARWVDRLSPAREARTRLRIEPIVAFDAGADALWESARARERNQLVRDAAYLNWRFGTCPGAQYLMLAARDARRLAGYLVARVAERRGVRVAYLVDFLAEADPVLDDLVARALPLLREKGAAWASALATIDAQRRVLGRWGFFTSRWGEPARILLRANGDDAEAHAHRDVSRWFLTMGDGDLEIAL